MPVFLEPDQSFPVVLESDRDKPADSRPVFFAKSQSMRGHERILAVLDSLRNDENITPAELFANTCAALGTVLTGWRNMSGHEFSVDAIRDVLTYQEARELLLKVAYNQHMTSDEKKD
jgi:hypothetical protein